MRKLRSIYVDVIVELFYKEKTTNYIHIHIYINTREYIYTISIFDTILKKKKEKQLISLMGEVFESCGRRLDNDKSFHKLLLESYN